MKLNCWDKTYPEIPPVTVEREGNLVGGFFCQPQSEEESADIRGTNKNINKVEGCSCSCSSQNSLCANVLGCSTSPPGFQESGEVSLKTLIL